MNISDTTFDYQSYYGLRNPAPKSELNMDTFLRLLSVQMANQNPLEPMNDRDFFAQMAQLGQVEGMDKMNDSLKVTQAASLIGKKVTALRPMTDSGSGQNALVTGTVTRLTVRNGEYFIGLKESNGGIVEVRVDSIREVASTTP
ncbi:MAG TPA: flagellar hook capping FlgD N-terminal domain-containing protein [Fimbriimonadaceae bacterium]|nr:flagellar hook capping FlgD N-terminal domain-containing protein [Fimbriimonadaceae bacterium]HRJ32075.1 flagellar hook capping FlgD N-terminal domain-containing protein [Fimbriimonadaceae bacterium]